MVEERALWILVDNREVIRQGIGFVHFIYMDGGGKMLQNKELRQFPCARITHMKKS